MSKFKDASENIKRLAVLFKGLIDMAEEIDKIDSLENYVVELEVKKSLVLKDCENLIVDKEILERQLESTKEKVPVLISETNEKAAKIIKDSELKATKLIEDSQAKVKEIDILIEEKLKKYQDKIQAMNSELKASEEKVNASEVKLKEVNLALEKIKGGI
jgi:hypothetical protein